ncbi:YggT family protein [Sphingomonas oligoaromativorans]|jgi:YggT family protein|uniref:YggT family protein n=1 Tax=Sphingomonas oligoaromativorans TaxID=575322 RepID=UPI00141EC43F|nr:YggT family protein [Sphingomonas oligoaromativorans]NIJ32986.1 YggT family protein [Sphingomonas oligoaromativorans]
MLSIFQILMLLLDVLFWIIMIQIVLSWLVAFNVINTRNDFVRQFLYALDRVTEPLYRPIRRILPDFGGLDFSPMVVLLAISILQKILLPNIFSSLMGATA